MKYPFTEKDRKKLHKAAVTQRERWEKPDWGYDNPRPITKLTKTSDLLLVVGAVTGTVLGVVGIALTFQFVGC